MLTPEHSTHIQNAIGGDIIMQLDDVVKSTITGPRVEEAMHRYNCYFNKYFVFATSTSVLLKEKGF